MSMRKPAGKNEIELFLARLGRTQKPGRVYLCGGAALVHCGIRPRYTLDIDLQIDIDPYDLIGEIEHLKQELDVNVE